MPAAAEVHRDEPIATVVLNRPDRLNALNLEMACLLHQHLQALAHDDAISAVVLTGAGRAFCAGGDLAWASEQPDGPRGAFYVLAGQLHQSLLELHQIDKPVIAAVNGVAAGAGFSLALACDFRVLDEGASLRQAYTSAGLSIDGGGTFTLPRLVGMARALQIAAFDEPIDAGEALELGLATRVAERGMSLELAHQLAHDLTARSLRSFAAAKRLLRRSFETPLETQLEREREALVVVCSRESVDGSGHLGL